jgi:uncharacterized protein DUF397
MLVWKTASYSQPQGGNCVQVACENSAWRVRDSKNPDGPSLKFEVGATTSFLAALKSDQLS